MLIKCPECGKDVSDKAPACIHCGFPLNNNDINLKVTCVINHVECNITPIKEYTSTLSTEEQKYFFNFNMEVLIFNHLLATKNIQNFMKRWENGPIYIISLIN